MTHKAKGEIEFDALGEAYVLVYDFNALVELEETFDVPAAELAGILEAGRAKDIRTVFRIGLTNHRPHITDSEAGDIISDVGTGEAGQLIGRAFTAAFPEAKEAGNANARPPRRKRSTQTAS